MCRTVLWLGVVLTAIACPPRTSAQPGLTSQYQLSDSIYLDEADSAARRHLTQVQAFLDAGQWDEAIETLRRVSGDYGDKVVQLAERRYLNVRDYCQLQFCQLPEAALARYRSQVDSQAQEWLAEGITLRDKSYLQRVVDQFFASSSGDDALDALAEIWLEQGDYGAARAAWHRLVPRDADVSPDSAAVADRIVYPDTDLDPGRLRARLALVSILEGDLPRAERELDELRLRHPEAQGRFGGREINYVEGLSALLANSRDWPAPNDEVAWSTFGGTTERTGAMQPLTDVGAMLWHADLDKVASEPLASIAFGQPQLRPAEKHGELLSYHPLVVGNLVLVNNESSIKAYDLLTGKPAFPNAKSPPLIYYDESKASTARPHGPRHLGVPRFTMTVHGNKLLARMGSCITAIAPEINPQMAPGYLVCLDLAAEGKLLWRVEPGQEKWAFEGTPICDGKNVYVAMRRSDVRPQAHVACLDAETGKERWRRFVCAAETPGRGQINESTHNMLTLHRGMLYLNTNLGAVAALSCDDGRISWITLYKRSRTGDLGKPASHVYRDLNPCVYDRGKIFVAPSDSELIIALDSTTGRLLWESHFADDAVHLLGVGSGRLFASGNYLWGFEVDSGKASFEQKAVGYGRGALVGDKVLFPIREGAEFFIRVYHQRHPNPARNHEYSRISLSNKATTIRGEQAADVTITGGNLLVAGKQLLIATSHGLIAFSQYSRPLDLAPQRTSLDQKSDFTALKSPLGTDARKRSDPLRQIFATPVTFHHENH